MHTAAQLLSKCRNLFSTLWPQTLKKQVWVFLLLSVIFIVSLVWIDGAQALTVDDIANGFITAFSQFFLFLSRLFFQLTIFFLKFFILLAGYNGYIDAPVVITGWNMVRDLANMAFVVILMVIAFATILGLEQYEWKKSLARLIVAAILVNFSNLIFQLIIDIAQVFTMTFLNAISATAGGNLINMLNMDRMYQIVYSNQVEAGIRYEILVAAIAILFFSLLAAAILGAYLIVMLARVVVLWVSIILSPLAILFGALPQTKGYSQQIWKEFTNHVIAAPVMVFFLWLAFSSFTGGTACQQIEANNSLNNANFCNATDIQGNSVQSTLSGATTWENMANFAVALAFMFVGLQQVQNLRVTGGSTIATATKFAGAVFTIASGVAIGQKLAGKTKDATTGFAKDVGVVAKGRTKATLRSLTRGKGVVEGLLTQRARLAATAENYRTTEENIKKTREHKGSIQSGTFSANTMAKSTIAAQNKAAEDEAETTKLMQENEQKVFDKEEETYQKRRIDLEDKAINKAIKENRDTLANVDATEAEKTEAQANINGLETLLRHRAIQEKVRNGETATEAEKTDLRENEKKAAKLPINAEEQRQLEREAAKGLKMHEARFAQEEAEEITDTVQGKVGEHFNLIRMSHLKAERDESAKVMEKNLEEALGDRIDKKKLELNAKDFKKALKDKIIAKLDATPEELSKKDLSEEKQAKLLKEATLKAGENAKQETIDSHFNTLVNEEKDKEIREDKYRKLEGEQLESLVSQIEQDLAGESGETMDDIRRTVAKDAVLKETGEAEIAQIKQQGMDKFRKISAMHAKRQAANKEGKGKSITEELEAQVTDQIRAMEGKKPEKMRALMRRKAKEELEDYSDFSYGEKVAEFNQMYDEIARLEKAQKADIEAGRADDAGKKKGLIKQYRQRLSRVVASAVNSGDAESIASSLAGKIPELQNKEWNTKENIGKVMLLATSPGKSWNDVSSNEDASALQEKMRKGLGDKADMIFRAMALAAENAVANKKQGFLTSLLREGLDKNGERKFGFAFAMDKGVGKGDVIGTGSDDDGNKTVDNLFNGIFKPSLKLKNIEDVRVVFKSEYKKNADGGIDEVFGGFQEGMEELFVKSLASMSEGEIRSLPTPIFNIFSGGAKAKGSIDVDGNKFDFAKNSDMQKAFHNLMETYRKNIETAATPQIAGMYAKQVKEVLRQMKVKNVNGQSIETADFAKKKEGDVEGFDWNSFYKTIGVNLDEVTPKNS